MFFLPDNHRLFDDDGILIFFIFLLFLVYDWGHHHRATRRLLLPPLNLLLLKRTRCLKVFRSCSWVFLLCPIKLGIQYELINGALLYQLIQIINIGGASKLLFCLVLQVVDWQQGIGMAEDVFQASSLSMLRLWNLFACWLSNCIILVTEVLHLKSQEVLGHFVVVQEHGFIRIDICSQTLRSKVILWIGLRIQRVWVVLEGVALYLLIPLFLHDVTRGFDFRLCIWPLDRFVLKFKMLKGAWWSWISILILNRDSCIYQIWIILHGFHMFRPKLNILWSSVPPLCQGSLNFCCLTHRYPLSLTSLVAVNVDASLLAIHVGLFSSQLHMTRL